MSNNPYINKRMYIELRLTEEQENRVSDMLKITNIAYKRMLEACLDKYKTHNDKDKMITPDYFIKDIKKGKESVYMSDIDHVFYFRYCKKTVSYNVNRAFQDAHTYIDELNSGIKPAIPKFLEEYMNGICYYLYITGNTTNALSGNKFGFIKDKLLIETNEFGIIDINRNPNNVATFNSIPQCSCVQDLRIICRNAGKGYPISKYTLTFIPSFTHDYGKVVR